MGRSAGAKGKLCDDAPSHQEEGAQWKAPRRIDIGAWIEEAYAALKVMVEEEEKSWPRTEARDTRLIDILEETNVAHKGAEEWYDDNTGKGLEEDPWRDAEKGRSRLRSR